MAPPNAGGPAGAVDAPAPFGGAPAAAPQQSFGSPQDLNPLGSTIGVDAAGSPFGGAPAPGFGAPNDPGGAPGGAPGPYGAPPAPAGSFGAPPAGGDAFGGAPPAGGDGFGAPPPGAPPPGAPAPGGFGPPPYGGAPGQPDFGAPGAAFGSGAMQPYGGGPMAPGAGLAGPLATGDQKSWVVTLVLALLAGGLGAHRFYTGHMLYGVLQLVTCGGMGIWALIDVIMIVTDKFTDAQGRPLVK